MLTGPKCLFPFSPLTRLSPPLSYRLRLSLFFFLYTTSFITTCKKVNLLSFLRGAFYSFSFSIVLSYFQRFHHSFWVSNYVPSEYLYTPFFRKKLYKPKSHIHSTFFSGSPIKELQKLLFSVNPSHFLPATSRDTVADHLDQFLFKRIFGIFVGIVSTRPLIDNPRNQSPKPY
jgi:hypothetical protein